MACLNERARYTKSLALIGYASGQDPLKVTCCVFFNHIMPPLLTNFVRSICQLKDALEYVI